MRSLPSLKEKRRYLVFEVVSERRHGLSEVKDSVVSAMLGLFGSCGAASSRMRFLADKWNAELQRGVIIVERGGVERLRAALCLVEHVGGTNAVVRSLGVSGILRKSTASHIQKAQCKVY